MEYSWCLRAQTCLLSRIIENKPCLNRIFTGNIRIIAFKGVLAEAKTAQIVKSLYVIS